MGNFKEWLNTKTYEYKQAACMFGHSDWIEVPEGAEIAIKFKYDPDDFGVIFYKNNGKSCFSQNDKSWQNDADWTMRDLLDENYSEDGIDLSHDILWQHEQNDPKSINDQYAEIEQVRQESKDNVNNPQHYNKGGVECIDAIEASMTPEAFKGYLKGNVQKYMWRYEQKGGVESLHKAQWYLERLVASMDS